VAHRPSHRSACNIRAAEMKCETAYPITDIPSDELLFKIPPPSKDDCPVCLLPMPISELRCAYMTCCGKFLCHGCIRAAFCSGSKAAFSSMVVRCALCREKTIVPDDVILQRVKKRMAANDGDAYFFLGCNYFDGTLGLKKNLAKAVELWLIGASLGSGTSQERLWAVYSEGWIVKKDKEKAVHYGRLAAMKGHVIARWNLGNHEKDKGITKVNVSNAVKHWKIAAMAGWNNAMDQIEDMLSGGYPRLGVTVEIYEETLAAYLVSQDERKSDQREQDRGTRDCSVSDQEIARKKRTGSEASTSPTGPTSPCSVCGKKVPKTSLLRCIRCNADTYFVCSRDCRRNDWQRHKCEDCLVVRVEKGLPGDACECTRCELGANEQGIGDDDVSEFFNSCHIWRGRPDVYKVSGNKAVPLTEEELNEVAYVYPTFTYMGTSGIFCLPRPKTFYAPNGSKVFTVRQLAHALAEAEEGNDDMHHMLSAAGGGAKFAGFIRHKDPHTFYSRFHM